MLKAKICSSKRKCRCDCENANKKTDDSILEVRYEKGKIESGM